MSPSGHSTQDGELLLSQKEPIAADARSDGSLVVARRSAPQKQGMKGTSLLDSSGFFEGFQWWGAFQTS